MQQVNTEIVYKRSWALQAHTLPNGVGRESLDVIGEVFSIGRRWSFNASISYTMTGFGTVRVLAPEYDEAPDVSFPWGGGRIQTVMGCARIADHLHTCLNLSPDLVEVLWAEGRYKLFSSLGFKMVGGPDDFTS